MKIGLFGGTFDPLHNGHIKVAQEAKNRLQLDKIIFIPSGDPPHKTDKKVTDKRHRFNMVKEAVEPVGAFVSDWEMNREEKSYSVETVRHFQAEYPEDDIYFIIGADSFRDIPTWWHYRELMSLCTFVVVTRPDVSEESLLSLYAGDEIPPRVFFLEGIFMDISSTEIRRMAKAGKDVSHLVPESVNRYMVAHQLYRS